MRGVHIAAADGISRCDRGSVLENIARRSSQHCVAHSGTGQYQYFSMNFGANMGLILVFPSFLIAALTI